MRVVFLGTPTASVPTLLALHETGHDIVLVVTGPDARRGRGNTTSPTPVKVAATKLGLPVSSDIADLTSLDVERGIVVAYGSIIKPEVLEKIPMLNVHFSLLPRWRGAAPVERAILAGDPLTGVSIISLDQGLDTGPVHLTRQVEIANKTSNELLEELSTLGAGALLEVLASPALLSNATPQQGTPTYAKKLTTETYRLTPDMEPELMLRIVRLGRAFIFVNSKRVRICLASPADPTTKSTELGRLNGHVVLSNSSGGSIILDSVLPEGKAEMSATSWWVGAQLVGSTPSWS